LVAVAVGVGVGVVVVVARLNLGCSDDLRGEWVNVDIAPPREALLNPASTFHYQQADLALPWTWPESRVDEIYAADEIDNIGDCRHIGDEWCDVCVSRRPPLQPFGMSQIHPPLRHWSGRIHVMNEAWRVLKPGGILTMECPDAAKGAGHFQDPQHVSAWTPNALQYYTDGSPAHKRFAAAYGITARFTVLGITERMYRETAGDINVHGVMCEIWKFNARLLAVKDE